MASERDETGAVADGGVASGLDASGAMSDETFDQAMAEELEREEAGEEPRRAPAKVIVIRDYCVRHNGAECNRCEIACPKGAISYSEEDLPVIDQDACTRCGICFGICDALSSTRITMIDLHARIRRIALRGEDVYLTCKENVFPGLEPAANVVVLPCLACLSPELWTLILAENIRVKVACDLSYCADCERAGEMAEMLYTHAIESAEAWTDEKVLFSKEIPEKEKLIESLANPTGVDRRSAFANLVGDVGDIASGKRRLRNSEVLQQFYERRERARAIARLNLTDEDLFSDFLPMGTTKKTMTPKRQLLLEAIDRKPAIAPRVPIYVSETDCERCTNTLECAKACPTGARFPDPETGIISMDVRYCIGCGICVEACAQDAVDMIETTAEALMIAEAAPEESADEQA